jgi:predicted dehydrogenase
VRIAFAGAGWISAVHGYALASTPDVAVTHVASRSADRAAARAAALGAEVCAYEDLPAGADGVVVATNPPRHAEDALRAIAGGAAVLLEKPLTTTLADADRLVDATNDGARILYAENLCFAPAVTRAVGLARDLGPLTHLEVRAEQDRPSWGDFLTREWGGGALFDLGVHPIAVALLLAAPAIVVGVRCRLEGADDHPTDEHAEATLRFDTGLEARVVSSWRATTPIWDAQAASATGVVRVELLPEPHLERNGVEVRLPAPREGVAPQLEQFGYLGQVETFLADIAARRQPVLGPVFGRTVLEIVCAAYSSAGDGGTEVPLPFQGRRDRTPLELWRP